jgi:hypothetical protein
MPLDASLQGALTAPTLTTLRAYFEQATHCPSLGHWQALDDVAGTMEAMANGTADAKIYVSDIDPGVGKSMTTVHFARALVSSSAHRDVGMLICVGRLNEATAIASALSISPDRLALLTSDLTRNAITATEPTNAQVLVTTQQQVERACDGRDFRDAAAFFYRGASRQVRVWDEAFLPGIAVTMDGDREANHH